MHTDVDPQINVPRRQFSKIVIVVLGLISLATVCSCQSESPRADIPESNYPEDEWDGYQDGGGGMPTYVPTQDGYETIEPSNTYQTAEPNE